VDEKAIAKRHRYVTLVSDLDHGTIEFIAFDRKTSACPPSHRDFGDGHAPPWPLAGADSRSPIT
jgi:hypothetical protein